MAHGLARDQAHLDILVMCFEYAPVVAGIPELDYGASSGLVLEHFHNSDWEDRAPPRYCYCGKCDICHAYDQWVDVATQIAALVCEHIDLNGLIWLRDYEDEVKVELRHPDVVIYHP